METPARPFIWQMLKEALESHGNKATTLAVRNWILERYPGMNVNTLLNQIIVCTVNHESRVHYRENQCPRRCNDVYDILYRPAQGKLELYDPRIHGTWEISKDDKGILSVREVKNPAEHHRDEVSMEDGYIEAPHLRAYLAKNLDVIESGLELYVDVFGNIGVDYPTEFGPIDLLAVDKHGAFVIVAINHDNFPDALSGQILRFKNWVKRHLAFGKPVRSYVVGPRIPEHMRYSLAECGDVFLREYALSIHFKEVPMIADIDNGAAAPDIPENPMKSLADAS